MGEYMSYSRIISALLLCLVAALGYTNWTLVTHEIEVSPLTSLQGRASDQFDPPVLQADPINRPLADYRETVTRPLFNPTRAPIVEMQAAASPAETASELPQPAPAPLEPSRLKVAGVMLMAGRTQRALLRIEGEPYGKWVDVGSEIHGWKLTRIERGLVVVEKEGGLEELLLHSPSR